MLLEEAIKGRRSIRAFRDTPLPRDLVLKIIEAGLWAPTACNRQLWKFVVVERDTFERKLKDVCTTISIMAPPVVLFVLYDHRYNREHHANYQSAAAAIQNMLLTAHSLGLGECWIAGYGDEQAIKRRLSIPQEYAIVAAVALGYGAETVSVPPHRNLEEVVCFNKFEGRVFPATWHPRGWSLADIRDIVGYSIRAKSPDPRYYRPNLLDEFKGDLDFIPPLPGNTLVFGPFAGNYLFELIREQRLEHVFTATYAHEINQFLDEKRERLGLDQKINYGLWDGHLALESQSIDNIICIRELERHHQPGGIIAEFSRVLKPAGQLILILSNALSPYYLLWRLRAMIIRRSLELRGPFRPLWPWEFNAMLRGKFRVTSREGSLILPYGRFSGQKTSGGLMLLAKSIRVLARMEGL